jgi:hypothetical protein
VAGRPERIAQNEALFRIANERKKTWPAAQIAADAGETVRFFCECGHDDCLDQLALTRPQYEAVRRDPMQFAMLPRHVIPDTERVVEKHGSYVVVRKHEDVRAMVEDLDPRS